MIRQGLAAGLEAPPSLSSQKFQPRKKVLKNIFIDPNREGPENEAVFARKLPWIRGCQEVAAE
jgi:hypothetical protein